MIMPLKKNRISVHLLSLLILVIFLQVPSYYSLASEKHPEDEKTLHLVLVPEKNVFEQRRRYKYITDYLSTKMDMNFTVEI
jgi:ABC-type phosphate/phosphonate transport system substrate-binding protein